MCRYHLGIYALFVFYIGFGYSQQGVSTKRAQTRVVVTGAASGVGFAVFKKLFRSKNYYPVALVQSNREARRLIDLGVESNQIFRGDITLKESLKGLFEGSTKAILCTSATPKKRFIFLLLSFIWGLFGRTLIPSSQDLYYPKGEQPYDIDFVGQCNIIDSACESKVEHIVLLGSMGGYRGSKNNNIGRSSKDASPKIGNVLKWKRAAERYLMKRCYFTIVHAGTLTDEKGGEREIVWDTDDALLRTSFRKIPKEDAAEVLLQALHYKEAIGRSIDVASRPPGQGAGPTKDWIRFWSRPGNCLYPAADPEDPTTTGGGST